MIEIVNNLGATLNCIEIPGIKNEITYLNGIFGLLAPYRNHGILNFLERCGASSSVKKIMLILYFILYLYEVLRWNYIDGLF
jgi:hypothetical protein